MTITEIFLQGLQEAVNKAGSATQLGLKVGIPASSITRWLSKDRSPTLTSIEQLTPFINFPTFDDNGTIIRLTDNSCELQMEKEVLLKEIENLKLEIASLKGELRGTKETIKQFTVEKPAFEKIAQKKIG